MWKEEVTWKTTALDGRPVSRMFVKEVGVMFWSPALQPPPPHSKKVEGSFSVRTGNQCCLLNRMQLTFTAWVQSLNTFDDDQGEHIDPVKNISQYQCMTFFPRVTIILVNNQLEAQFVMYVYFYRGTAVAQWLRCCATNRKVAGSIPASVSGFFIDIKSFRSHYSPGVYSASNKNEHQEHFLGVKAAGA